jgi:peroxiredoxin (alkyl hydroperoxide reductase subunit C)
LTAVAAKYTEFNKRKVEFLAISVDSIFVHKMWHEAELSKMVAGGIPYPLLSDMGGKVGQLYGVYDETDGVDLRARFIIDPDGVIKAIEVLATAVGRNIEELLRQIQAFQLVRKTKGAEETPANWTPGKMTLKPGPELVGKVWKVWKP